MKAVVITRSGGSEVLEIQERAKPEPGLGQIRVKVHASALNRAGNFSDIADMMFYYGFMVLAWMPLYLLCFWLPRWL